LNVARAFFHHDLHRGRIAEAGTRADSILLVQVDFIFVAQRGGNASLRVLGGGFGQVSFAQDKDVRAGAGQFNRRTQTGNATPDNKEVGLLGCAAFHQRTSLLSHHRPAVRLLQLFSVCAGMSAVVVGGGVSVV